MAYSEVFKENTSEQILKIMGETELSQREFAEKIKVDPSAISNLKRKDAWHRIPSGYWQIFQLICTKQIEFNGSEMVDHRKPDILTSTSRKKSFGDDEIPVADYLIEYTRDDQGRRKLILNVMTEIVIELSLKHGAEVTIKTI